VAARIAERAAGDPEFLAKLQTDPEETLIEAGLHESAVGDFMREAGLSPEVAGYILEELDAPCQYSCMPNSTPGH
jgi:hypothetical protein